jgi:hypothetical protein
MYFMLGRGIAVSSINNILKFVSAVNQPESRLHGHTHIHATDRNKWIKRNTMKNSRLLHIVCRKPLDLTKPYDQLPPSQNLELQEKKKS